MVIRMLSVVVVGAVMMGPTELCFARLGETEAELEKRYGKPYFKDNNPVGFEPAEKNLHFEKDNIRVSVTVFRGRSVLEAYQFMDPDGYAPLRVADNLQKAEALLEANAAGAKWQRRADLLPGMTHAWTRSDEKAVASVWEKSDRVLQVADVEFNRESGRHERQSEAGVGGF